MVQMTHARTYNPKTGQWGTITAKAYTADRAHYQALEESGELECRCPDPHCASVRLSHYADRLHTYYGENGLPYRLNIPSYFQRRAGTAAHHPDCAIVREYGAYQERLRQIGGLSVGHGVFLFNLNFPHAKTEGPVRKPRYTLEQTFAPVVQRDPRERPHPGRKLSEGMKDLKAFSAVLEKAAYDPVYRRLLYFRKGAEVFTLEELYRESPLELFRAAQARSHEGTGLVTAITAFKPAVLPQFWKRGKTGPGTIYGQPASARGKDGHHYHVNTVLHVEDRALYASIKEQFHAGNPSFLVYSEKIYIDHEEIQARNAHAAATGENTAFHVHVHVTRPEQVMAWAIPPALKELDFGAPLPDGRTGRAVTGQNGAHPPGP